jgi:integrase
MIGSTQEDTPKSDAGERTIALDAGTVDSLRAHRQQQRKDRMAAGTAWVNSGKVFTAEDGSALNPERITDWFRELTAEAGHPPIRLHDLRHGAASLMLAGGVSMETVQETQGHSSLVLTANTYTSVYPEVATAAAVAGAAIVPLHDERRAKTDRSGTTQGSLAQCGPPAHRRQLTDPHDGSYQPWMRSTTWW